MLSSALSLVPVKPLLIGGGILSLNKRIVFPTAKKIASGITTSLGILSGEEAKQQEEIFDNIMFPIDDFISNVEDEIYNILLGGDSLWNQAISFLTSKKNITRGENIIQGIMNPSPPDYKVDSSMAVNPTQTRNVVEGSVEPIPIPRQKDQEQTRKESLDVF